MLNHCGEVHGRTELFETAAPDLKFLLIIICGPKEMDIFILF
jgi:hypothetical protein